MSYNIEYKPTYIDNFQYRQCLRDVFSMDVTKSPPKWEEMDADLDNETRDELLYEETSLSSGLDYIYEATKSNCALQQLYLDAAAVMLSQTPDIGLAVLFSYDYFELFHTCLGVFFENPSGFSKDTPAYINVRNKFIIQS